MTLMRIQEGFKDQLLYIIPHSLMQSFVQHPLVHPLGGTSFGWYPHAKYHYCERVEGSPQHILILCVDGFGWYEIGGIRRTVSPGEALIIPRCTPHIYGAADLHPWSIHWVHFTGGNAEFFTKQLPEQQFTLRVAPEAIQKIRQLFKDCYDTLDANFVLQRVIYASQTLHYLLGCLFFNNRAFSPMMKTSRFRDLNPTIAYLQQNLHNLLTLDQMAAHAELSVPHFSRLFKDQTGYSPIDYYIHLKMQHACTQLCLTRKKVRVIAEELGYEDPYYFSRLFKKIMSVSPNQFRVQGEQWEFHPSEP